MAPIVRGGMSSLSSSLLKSADQSGEVAKTTSTFAADVFFWARQKHVSSAAWVAIRQAPIQPVATKLRHIAPQAPPTPCPVGEKAHDAPPCMLRTSRMAKVTSV